MSVLRVRRAARPSGEAHAPGWLNATTMREIKELPDYTRSKGLDCQHNFANMSACLHAPMRIRRLFERESAVHDRFDATLPQSGITLAPVRGPKGGLSRLLRGRRGGAVGWRRLIISFGELNGGLGGPGNAVLK